jgi:hypothetical protein
VARGKPVDLGHRSFQTNKDAQDYFRGEIRKRQVGEVITNDDDFFRDVRSLIDRHPERVQKIGVGIEAFIVKLDENRNKMLWLRRNDGSSTDFSYLTCIRGAGKSLHSEFTDAARFAISPDIKDVKEGYFRRCSDSSGQSPCEQTGKLMAIEEAHVDHYPIAFKELVQNFLDQTSIVPSREILSAPADEQTATTFTCDTTATLFIQYHRENATLMVVHKSVNLTRKRK